MTYQPPCTITPVIERLLGQICEFVGRHSLPIAEEQNLKLRRINRIRTIQGSLAIEGNTLSEDQITAILAGKPVVAPLREIQEVKNAIEVYDRLEQWNPYKEEDLLAAHEIMMQGLIDYPGRYRGGGVGIMGRNEIIHVAPPASRVNILMRDLFNWLERSEHHPLVASSIFHYEFEFIHPFADGNGRMGRLWQSLILTGWNSIFAITPVESMVHAHQQAYYEAIGQSTKMGDSAAFVAFMLETILAVLEQTETDQVTDQVSDQVIRLLNSMDTGFMSVSEMMGELSLVHRPTFSKNYLHPALESGLLEMKYPDNPRHPGQSYRLTPKGRNIKALL